MAEVDTSIYKMQTPPANPLAQITDMGKMADAVGNFQVGQAVQQAAGPDGSIDQNQVLNLLRQSPAGAMKAIPTMDALAKLRQAGFASDQAGLETFQKRMAITSHLFSGLASNPNPTMDDVHDIAAKALDPSLDAKKYGITMPVIMNQVMDLRKAYEAGGPAALRKRALQIQTQAATTGEVLSQHSPQFQVVNQGKQLTVVPIGTAAQPAMGTAVPLGLPPTTPTVNTKTGQPQYLGPQAPVPGGGVVTGTGQPAVPGAPAAPQQTTGPVPAGMRPGYTEAATSTAAQNAALGNALVAANDNSMARKGMLGNLEEDLRHFTSGPGADWTKVAKAWANRNLPVPEAWQKEGGLLDPKSIASQEQFIKQAQMLAQQQFQTIGGTGTDAKFNSAFTTNPNDLLSQMGNQGIIRLLKGNEDAIQAKTKAWNAYKAKNGADKYAEFSQDFNQHFDPRVFQFKYIAPKDRQAYIDNMDPNDAPRFLHDLTYARKQGWVNFGTGK